MSMKEDKAADKAATELTRREWLLRLGEITALVGVAGLVPELATTLATAEEQAAAALPPGLYDPSPRHLMHALSAQGAPNIPPGSETDYVQPRQGPFQPRFFSPDEFRLVSRLVEILLGNVDAGALVETVEWVDLHFYSAAAVRQAARRLDPLHRALAAGYYGEARVVELETDEPQDDARTGLTALEQHSRELHGRPFVDLAVSEQVELVREIDRAAQETPQRRFYDRLRREAIRGYYTSRWGLKELDYKGNAYYSECPGCEKK
jgi:hypothetical protein